ncbi:hypothetical protein [Magnetospira sp. QH-2]|uniref:hypothetical protein n=1 Tax=Magnetospira sp. (strain QH-2) TaxID=1288970 RepID=UPI00130EB597|nr:hypothetical protein [Magnetospira sp. QH-2]
MESLVFIAALGAFAVVVIWAHMNDPSDSDEEPTGLFAYHEVLPDKKKKSENKN